MTSFDPPQPRFSPPAAPPVQVVCPVAGCGTRWRGFTHRAAMDAMRELKLHLRYAHGREARRKA